jgi:uncharacterized membrane protein
MSANRPRGRSWSLAAVTLVVVFLAGGVAGAFVDRAVTHDTASGRTGGTSTTATTAPPAGTTSSTTTAPPPVLSVVSMTPQSGATDVAAGGPVTVSFSAPLSESSPTPRLAPAEPGSWRSSGDTFTFTPSGGLLPLSELTLTVPGGPTGVLGSAGGRLAQSVREQFQVADAPIARVQQLLSLLDYSPLSWSPAGAPISPSDSAAQIAALYKAPAGNYAWRNRGWPAQLRAMWQPGVDDVFTRGLIMSFQADHALTPNGAVTASLYSALLAALASNSVNTGGYDYAFASKATPESLTIFHNGRVVLHTPANTGIGASPTPDGTFPVYERLRRQVMRGHNPDGSSYADLVQYIAYFNGNDAVHYMDRADYGIPQSLGCIELPLSDAAQAWPYLAYGTLVTIVG